ncbi:hypothetical protein C2S53_012994 [Perilla frutescens var. hirtella]|uniref:Protein PHYTOCHROME KINASE SUBSTRATE 1-like n=1 Tax=Perilla frutescens var. hirtella TaxID=608512 RepID=A0AAD4IMQ5_PERFH|nr:hypothetical protein C2S53_012994 [Perilla frutescens var. hirtella]
MPVITMTPPSKTSIPHPPEIIKNSREASFSSYLDGAEETFLLKLGAANDRDRIFLGKNTTDEKEIDVFDAEKYFNDSPKLITRSLASHQLKKDDPTETLAIKELQPAIASLSIRSESSWNSRSALLPSAPTNQQLRKANKKSFLTIIGCNCTCADKNSVDIDDYIPTTGLMNGRSKQLGDKTNDQMRVPSSFSFPKMQLEREEAAKRRSQMKNCFNMEKKLAVVTWDAIAPSVAEELKIPSISSEMHNDDSDSDASSDLFEIESLYKDNPFDHRQASDALSGCYAPSEASIEWSVVTASAADFSVLSDSDEIASTISIPCPKKSGGNTKTASFKEMPRIRPSLLLGCKSHKAVSVAGDAHTRRHLTPMTRFHDESKLSFDAKTRQNSFDARIISQPRSASAAHLLFT